MKVSTRAALGAAFCGALATLAAAWPRNAAAPAPAAAIVVVPAAPAPVAASAAPAATAAIPAPAFAPARVWAANGNWWRPAKTDSWQWQLSGTINTRHDAAIYDIDLFDAPAATIAALHAAGRRVVCYFSAGSSENWRADFGRFAKADMGRPLDGWAGERWIDTRSANVRAIMADRLAHAAARGCDGVEPDNVDGYANRNGLGLTAADQLDYNRFLAAEAHRQGLAIGLKNDLDQVAVLAPAFDFAVNEQCWQYRECGLLAPFTDAGKPVLNAEYAGRYRTNKGSARDALCAAARAAGMRTLVLPLKLDDRYRFSCD